MRSRSATSPTAWPAGRRSCSPGRGRNGNYRAPSGWNFSNSSPSAVSTAAPPTASSADRPGRPCGASRPQSGRRRMDLLPPTCWNGFEGADRANGNTKADISTVRLTAGADAQFMAAESARLRPDSAIIGVHRISFRPMRMASPKSFSRVFTERGPLITLAVAVALLVGIAGPASAQFFFNFGGPPRPQPRSSGHGWFGGDLFTPFQQQAPKQRVVREDFSRAPPPEKRETVPERNVLVLGDAMADWLAYGLEDAYADQPEIGVIRKHKTYSGLIKYQPRGEPADWAAAAKAILATEKPEAIVVMLGLNDRIPIHEPAAEKSDKKNDKKDARAKPEAKPADPAKPNAGPGAKPDDKAVDSELSPDDAADDAPPSITPERSARSPNGLYEFREERWVELYAKKIEEMIGVLKSKGVPVVWVGLPAIRGPKGTSDMLFLDSLYRDAAGKAGITYVDVWDGFVDEAGRYLQQGPDFKGQIRRLRSYDGVYFTQAGARKLAHYVEREITRLLAARSAPITLPTEPATADANATPGQP